MAYRSHRNEDWHLTIRLARGGGSVEHFHHFLLGFFIPLIHLRSTKWVTPPFKRLFVRSCGPLDPLIKELGDDCIEIIDKDQHRQLAEVGSHKGSDEKGVELRLVTVRGCDWPCAYDKRKFTRAREVLLSIDAFQRERRLLKDEWSPRRILLIKREPSLAFYNSERSEIKTSGQERRSIANQDELYRSLRGRWVGCLCVSTETLTIARQVALFSLADIIIAQHGAALANVVWARQNATVIEIFPYTSGFEKEVDFFGHLCRCMGLRYRRVLQSHEHSDVDIDEVHKIVAECITSPGSPLMSRIRSIKF